MLTTLQLTPSIAYRICNAPSVCRQCGEKFTVAAPGNLNICFKCGSADPSVLERIYWTIKILILKTK